MQTLTPVEVERMRQDPRWTATHALTLEALIELGEIRIEDSLLSRTIANRPANEDAIRGIC